MRKLLNKYFLSCIFCFASFVFLAQTKSTNIQTINGASFYIHKIEKGQSLYAISKLYNVSLDEIYLNNPDVKAGTKANQEIKIPVKHNAVITKTVTPTNTFVPTKTVSPANTIVPTNTAAVKINTTNTVGLAAGPIDTNLYYTYIVGKRETLYSISKKFKLTEAELKIFNPSLISQGPKDGQTIIVGEKKRVIVKQNTVVLPVSTHPDSVNPNVIRKPKKTSYNVALILPFRLDQTLSTDLNNLVKTRSNFPVVSGWAVDFYLGFKKVVDSLTTKDFEVNIDLYDVDDRDSAKLVQIVSDPKFKQTDFIFGPLHANGFKTIAKKAKESGIPIVSPATQQNKMLFDNVYVSKTNPSQFTLLESLADYCIDSLMNSNANIILVAPFGNDLKEISYVKAFKKYYNEKQKLLGKSPKDTVALVKGIVGVKSVYVPGVKNIIVMLSNNQVFIADFTTQLTIFSEKKDIVLCGWENIGGMDNIDQDYLNQLHFTFPTQYNITNTNSYGQIIENYKTQQNTFPGEYYFRGFDIGYYYLKNLRDNGPDFIFKLNQLPEETGYMRFKFTRPDNTTGFDNRGVYIFRYTDYQLVKTGWK